MNFISDFLQSDACRQLVTVLLHSLWQAPVLAALLWLVLRSLPAKTVNTRYALSLACLCLLPLLMAGTWSAITAFAAQPQQDLAAAEAPTSTVQGTPSTSTQLLTPSAAQSRLKWTAIAAGLWFCGAILMLLRTIISMAGVQNLRNRCTLSNDSGIEELIRELSLKLGLRRRIRVFVGAINSPATIGLVSATVLLPVELAATMPPGQLRLILAHELAHIRRYDYFVNMMQMLIEALLFFNPAVYWLNLQIRREREAACDALAVAVTGEKREYAQALADFAIRQQESTLLAFSSRDETALSDRLRRLLQAAHYPYSRLPLLSLVLTFSAGLICLALYCAGASWAVSKVLTPRERMEKLNAASELHNVTINRTEPINRDVEISGTVQTEDGSPLTSDITVLLTYRLPHTGNIIHPISITNGRFNLRMPSGIFVISARMEGYAPAVIGPRELAAGESWSDAALVLRRGTSAEVRVMDEDGAPIPGVNIVAASFKEAVLVREWLVQTDAEGLALLENIQRDHEHRLQFLAIGFQHLQVKRSIKPGETLSVNLQQARAIKGQVTDRDTGAGVHSARICLMPSEGAVEFPCLAVPSYRNYPVIATTDAEGRFELGSLRNDTGYDLGIFADGHAPGFKLGVRTGQQDISFKLGPPLLVKGLVIGYEMLPKKDGKYWIGYSNSSPSWINMSGKVPLEIKNGEGHFEINDIWEGEVVITARSTTRQLQVTKPVDDLVIDLRPSRNTESNPMRAVLIKLLAPAEAPPTGQINVNIIPGNRKIPSQRRLIALKDGAAHLSVPVPCGISIDPGKLVGYCMDPQGPLACDTASMDTFVIEVPVDPAGAITGKVLDARGNPIPDVPVSAQINLPHTPESKKLPPNHRQPVAFTDREGRYMLTPIPFGVPYVLMAQVNSLEHDAVSRELMLDETNPLQECVIALQEEVSSRGKVSLPDGAPAEAVLVELWYQGAKRGATRVRKVSTDRAGAFELPGLLPDAPEKYRLFVIPERDYKRIERNITPGDASIEVILERGERLKGVVVDENSGEPIQDIGVHVKTASPTPGDLYANGLVHSDAPTNEKGEFEFTRLEPVEYVVQVFNNSVAEPPHIIGGKDTDIVLKARRKAIK